jgi:hypothetical protein
LWDSYSPPHFPADPPPTFEEVAYYRDRMHEALLRVLPMVTLKGTQDPLTSVNDVASRALDLAELAVQTAGV